ncbi:MAG TPA: peptidyl-prolyl cis-trans isomerase [Gemmatimonadales bacterium]|nr:peptidyl-prolyl cis-trans isomerase [Gemmatimonadales bacterium]
MMQTFRNSAKVAGAIFALLMLIFVLTSVDWSGLTKSTSVGKINGQSVDTRTFQGFVQQSIDNRQRDLPTSLTLEERHQIEDQVWEELIQNRVLETEYERRGISVSTDEIVQAIRNSPPADFRNVPEFQTDSQFDMNKYQRWLTSSVGAQYLPALEAQYRDQLRRSKLLRVVAADIYLSDAALWEQYRDENEQVKVAVTAIIPRNAVPDSAVKLTDEEVTAYYRSHQDDFKRSRTAFLSFVALPRLTNASDTAFAKARADSAKAAILAGEPFADVARRESSDSVSAAAGGDLGEWTKGSMDPAFDSAAFAMPLKKVSQPVLSQFGFHIIEITSRKGNKAKGRHILIPIEVAGEHRDHLDAEADSLERLAAEREDPAALDTVSKALSLPIGGTGGVQEGTRVQVGNLVVPDAGAWAFGGSKPGHTSPVIETSFAFYIFRIDSVQPAGVPPLAQVRPAVEFALRNDKKKQLVKPKAEEYLKRLANGESMAAAAKAMNLPNREFGPFSRVNPPLTDPMVVGTAFGLEKGQRSGLLDTPDGMYVMESLERVPADSAKFVKELDEYRTKMIDMARQARVRGYLAALRQSAKIVDNRARLRQQQQEAAETQQPPVT